MFCGEIISIPILANLIPPIPLCKSSTSFRYNNRSTIWFHPCRFRICQVDILVRLSPDAPFCKSSTTTSPTTYLAETQKEADHVSVLVLILFAQSDSTDPACRSSTTPAYNYNAWSNSKTSRSI